MTREEAIMVVHRNGFVTNSEAYVRIFEQLGILKLDEPKTIAQRATQCLSGPFVLSEAIEIQDLLDRAGLKIVTK